MDRKRKTRSSDMVAEQPAWEARHANDGRGPIADNTSQFPDRTYDLPEGSAGESEPVHASGYQEAAGAIHPNFPDQGSASLGPAADEDVRRRAHELWEAEGRPEGGHERHWLQAERELHDGGA